MFLAIPLKKQASLSRAEDLKNFHGLLPHPEGGFFKETYRSAHSTAIFYLLNEGAKSSLHRIKSDELWHFYEGDELIIVELLSSGEVRETKLNKENPQHIVPGGVWFGAYLREGSTYAFVGCTVSPAFHYSDFEIGKKAELLAQFPKAQNIIERLNS